MNLGTFLHVLNFDVGKFPLPDKIRQVKFVDFTRQSIRGTRKPFFFLIIEKRFRLMSDNKIFIT